MLQLLGVALGHGFSKDVALKFEMANKVVQCEKYLPDEVSSALAWMDEMKDEDKLTMAFVYWPGGQPLMQPARALEMGKQTALAILDEANHLLEAVVLDVVHWASFTGAVPPPTLARHRDAIQLMEACASSPRKFASKVSGASAALVDRIKGVVARIVEEGSAARFYGREDSRASAWPPRLRRATFCIPSPQPQPPLRN